MATRGDSAIQSTLLGEAVEHASAAIFLTDENGRCAAVNVAACELTGYSRDELVGVPPDAIDGGAAEDLARKLHPAASASSPRGRAPLRRKDGTSIDVEYSSVETAIAGVPFFMVTATRADGL